MKLGKLMAVTSAITLVLFMQMVPQPVVSTETFFCGPPPMSYWMYNSNTSIWWPMGPCFAPEEIDRLHEMADSGVKINLRVLWWGRDETLGMTSLDMYYNESFCDLVEQVIDYNVVGTLVDGYPPEMAWEGFDPSKLWGITLGDEEPGFSRELEFYDTLSPQLTRYSSEYQSETGFTMKPLNDCNQTEYTVFWEWYIMKNVWAYSHLYDYVKSEWPHLKVFQFTNLEPVWYIMESVPSYQTSADGYYQDCYYAQNVPLALYEAIRAYKTAIPDKPIHMAIWGIIWDFVNTLGDGEYYREGSFEQFRRETWISYLAGVDALGWFNWGPSTDQGLDWRWGVNREDELGMQTVLYTHRLAEELEKLPHLTTRPQVLLLGERHAMAFPYSLYCEFDTMGERAFAHSDPDLSQYRLIVVSAPRYRESTVTKLNEYVEGGGNVLFFIGMGDRNNIYGNMTREVLFPLEHNSTEFFWGGNCTIDITKPNALDLELKYQGYFHDTRLLDFSEVPADCQVIGMFNKTEGGEVLPLDGIPLVLYRNSSKPTSGHILYWGAKRSSTDPNATAETCFEEDPDVWYLNRVILQAYAKFLNITNCITPTGLEDMIITHGLTDDEEILIGIQNLANRSRNVNCEIDLSNFDVSDGGYWIHSIDAGTTLGTQHVIDSKLVLSLDVQANGTRLLLMNELEETPDLEIEIFPQVPDIPSVPSTPNTSTTTTESLSKSTKTTSVPGSEDYWPLIITGTTSMSLLVLVLYAYQKRQEGQSSLV